MSYDVFISYSSKDNEVAHEVCDVLEKNNLKCWIAPRNIISGERYTEGIIDGLKDSKIIVLIFSGSSQESEYVKNEIHLAFGYNNPILSFRIDETMPKDEMEFFLKNNHWLDAYPEPRMAFKRLVEDVTKLCNAPAPKFTISRKTIRMENDHISVMLAAIPAINGLALVYMGYVVNMKKWIAVGIICLIPTLFALYYWPDEYYVQQMTVTLFYIFILWIFVAFVSVFILRKQFLARKTASKIWDYDDYRFESLVDEILNRDGN